MSRYGLLAALVVVLFVTSIGRAAPAIGGIGDRDEVCNATADYFLGSEDYPQAVKSHLRVIAAHPDDALAHYHLGFAYGMLGDSGDELVEYRRAVSLGLKKWDLFLNLGRLYLEKGDLEAATEALTTAKTLGPDHAETYFNLGLADERRGALGRAHDEMLTSLRLDPNQLDARNMLALIDAEQGRLAEARRIWSALATANPDFSPARENLALLDHAGKPSLGAEVSATPSSLGNAALVYQ